MLELALWIVGAIVYLVIGGFISGFLCDHDDKELVWGTILFWPFFFLGLTVAFLSVFGLPVLIGHIGVALAELVKERLYGR